MEKMNKDEWRIILTSESEYEKLAADIMIGNKLICTVNQDQSLDDPLLEFYPKAMKSEMLSVPLSTLLEAIEAAKAYLAEKQ